MSNATARWMDAAEVARHIRKALKAAFPTVKFSVTTSKYSGGASVNVSFTDTVIAIADVKAIAGPFAGSTFDSMIGGESVRSGADFVFVDRRNF
tara:strand:- start:5811 stop:6092 length:282 start_codon:yes stop_codon:yes gene_type:complete